MSHRTQITLTDAQYIRLKQESVRSGVGLAELVRRALDAVGQGANGENSGEVLAVTFGSWQSRELDGAAYVESLRRGMGRRLAE